MLKRCACFTTDNGYLFPTLLSAIQARHNIPVSVADIIIVLFSDESETGIITEICSNENIILIVCDAEVVRGYSTMYARLFLDEILPSVYDRILYIDGDVQITYPLTDLIKSDLDGHAFSAAADPMAILAHDNPERSHDTHKYFESLGVRNTIDAPYFNSGVLLIDRDEWRGVAADAFEFLSYNPELCRFQDQSALNFAGHRHFTPMSVKWNFPIFYRNCGVEQKIQPAIYHFMSKPKPWHGDFAPWNRSFVEPYIELRKRYPELAKLTKPMRASQRIKYFVQQNLKRIQETAVWRFSSRRDTILTFDRATRLQPEIPKKAYIRSLV